MMDKQKAKILFDLLKSSNSEKVIKGLREIKKRLLTSDENINVFSNLGLAKQCLKLIQRPNEELLNGTLSILSIACTNHSLRSEIYDNNGVLHLYNVFKSTQCESLQLRACRTIANQSQHKASCDQFFKLGCVELIINLLRECKDDETRCASVRALRLLADTGDHCRKIVVARGIFYICNISSGSSSSNLTLEMFKALAHFSRISHPACLKQIMEGTDNMTIISKYAENIGNPVQETLLRTILNIVRGCADLKKQFSYSLVSNIMDNLAMARAPSIIVWELQNRRVPEISEDKLILALCEFCEGFGPASKFNYPPLFMGRTWSQMVDCGGIHLFVSLLSQNRDNIELRAAVLRALTGIEFVLSSKDLILKHLLAANVMPQLADQFDDVMAEYRKVRRAAPNGLCVHTIPNELAQKLNTSCSDNVHSRDMSSSNDENGGSYIEKTDNIELNLEKSEISEEIVTDLPKVSICKPRLNITKTSDESSSPIHGGNQDGRRECGSIHNPNSPPIYNPYVQNHSLSCSPVSNQSSGGSAPSSPTWSPNKTRCESPTFSPPLSNIGSTVTCPWDSPTSSHQSSPSSSPVHYPMYHSPLHLYSPIRPPSDWEYEDEDLEEDACDDGRFSPAVPKSKDLEEMEEELDDPDESEATNTEETTTDDESLAADKQGAVEAEMKNKLVISSASHKRSRDSPSISVFSDEGNPLEKKLKKGYEDEMNPSFSQPIGENGRKELNEEGHSSSCNENKTSVEEQCESSFHDMGHACGIDNPDASKTPFIKLNQIKFRVRKKPRRQLDMETDTTGAQNSANQNSRINSRRTSSVCSDSCYSDLTTEEYKWLQLLELLVRVIGQIAFVKETINTICREFVPRITTYLSTAQVIHKSATQMLRIIARNSLSIPLLLDSLFIPYVAVELGEAGDPENPSGCGQCRILCEGAMGFLNEMVNFFNHVHHFGRSEVNNRLHPSRDHSVREGCVMTLPHVTRCPRLLYDFMVSYPAMDLLMQVLHSDRPASDASYMYATAAISRLAMTLQLDKQLQPVKCPVCSERRTHSPEEIAKHLRMQQENMKSQEGASCHTSTEINTGHCKFKLDKVKDITFKLENGETLSANREFLSEKNDVLNGMLSGSFAEGKSTSVDLATTSKTSLEMLIHYLYGCQCDFLENANFRSYLQLVFLSQMYMVKDLDAFAMLKMISAIGEGSDIVMLYESELGRINEHIVLQAICTTLVRPMKTWKRARWFKELFQSKHADDIDHNIRLILHHPLDLNRLVCNCDQSLSLYAAKESVYSKLC
ncbi:hypothetical protein SK128_018719 [Halocaridina rubra]|uniref:BTB domain-containing protein n=1 Tax=Halocaridina rubra TaxID=373956 RepID=A0AAN8WZ92_HALRR